MTKEIKKAFTLAEVLITLAIIGVVAAMTLPTLIQKHQKQQWVTGLQNAYSTISNGFNLMKTQEGTNSLYDTEFFNGSHNCLLQNVSDEELEVCSNILKQYFKIISCNHQSDVLYPKYILSNGISLSIMPGFIFVDVNGNKKPNKYGRDKFVLQYFDNGKVMPNTVVNNMNSDEIIATSDDIYRQIREYGLDLSSIFDKEFLKEVQRIWQIYSELYSYSIPDCEDINTFWSCTSVHAVKSCPSYKPYPDDPDEEYDGGMFCAARIMADGWKMNY